LETPTERDLSTVVYRSPECRAELAEYGSIGGHLSWANTPDRNARLANAHANSPADLSWHARKLGLDPDNLTPTEHKRAANAMTAYYKQMAMKANKVKAAKRAAGQT
jgi:hypothetical protein